MISYFLPCVLALVLMWTLSTHAVAVPRGDSFRLASGRSLSWRAVLRHASFRDVAHARRQLYELREDAVLVGHDRTVHLLRVAAYHGVLPRVASESGVEPELLVGGGYSVTRMPDGCVVAVHGNGLALEPLHHTEHPHIFVNLRDADDVPRDLSHDVRHVPPPPPSLLAPGTMEPATEGGLHAAARMSGRCRARLITKEVLVAASFDSQRCAKYGKNRDKVVAGVRASLLAASEPFKQQTCVRLRVVHIDGECDPEKDPYRGYNKMDADGILDSFTDFWNKERREVKRHVAVFLPGFEEQSRTSGIAWFGTACMDKFGYAWAEKQEPIVIAHEIGHVLKADHAAKGMMRPEWNVGDKLLFSSFSLDEISTYVDSEEGSCLPPAPIPDPPTTGAPVTSVPVTPKNTVIKSVPPPTTNQAPTTNRPPTTNQPTTATTVTTTTTTTTTTTVATTAEPSIVDGSGTCQDGFVRTAAFKCTRRIVRISLGQSRTVHTKVTLVIKHGEARIIFRGYNRARLHGVSHVLSMDATLTERDVPELYKLGRGGGLRMTMSASKLERLARPRDIGSAPAKCCGRSLTLYVRLKQCRGAAINTCESKFVKMSVLLRCMFCGKKRKFLPMSASKMCPTCKPA